MARTAGFGKKKQQRPPEGKIRRSQLVTTFGPGAMVDLLDHAVLVGGLDFWRYDKKEAPIIDEPRLRDAIAERFKQMDFGVDLNESAAFKGPPTGDDKEPKLWSGIQCAEFPAWFVCQNCRALHHGKDLEKKKGRYVHACTRTKTTECVPVRFVASCPKGHLTEFPWRFFAHAEHAAGDCGAPELRLAEGPTGDFSEVVVQCVCGAWRPLSKALAKEVLPYCDGDRPWLGDEGREECTGEHLSMLMRTASNAYFSQVMSALSIPDPARELEEALRAADVWSVVKAATPQTLGAFRTVPHVGHAIGAYGDEQVLGAVGAILKGQTPTREALRTAEYKQLMAQPLEESGDVAPPDVEFYARRLPRSQNTPAPIGDIVLAKKLREVRAQIGFSRFRSVSPNLQGDYEGAERIAPLGLTTDWLPAVEVYGEGVLLCLDESRVAAWEKRPAVEARGKQLLAGFHAEFPEGGPDFPGVRFYLLHSLGHLLINAISLTCGYSASAIRERIYCAPADDETPMAAVLLSTGTSGTEGTLGGLAEQGRYMLDHLRRAYDLGALCSNDPVCASHDPGDQSERYLEGAACHGCLFVAECSCERFNRYLDRALVFPCMGHEDGLAFFEARP